jgi:hypothetical protein
MLRHLSRFASYRRRPALRVAEDRYRGTVRWLGNIVQHLTGAVRPRLHGWASVAPAEMPTKMLSRALAASHLFVPSSGHRQQLSNIFGFDAAEPASSPGSCGAHSFPLSNALRGLVARTNLDASLSICPRL